MELSFGDFPGRQSRDDTSPDQRIQQISSKTYFSGTLPDRTVTLVLIPERSDNSKCSFASCQSYCRSRANLGKSSHFGDFAGRQSRDDTSPDRRIQQISSKTHFSGTLRDRTVTLVLISQQSENSKSSFASSRCCCRYRAKLAKSSHFGVSPKRLSHDYSSPDQRIRQIS